MKAAQLIEHGKPGRFEIVQRVDPKPAADEVVVRVRACGLNRLDLWLEEAGLPIPLVLPRIPGSEIAGEIEAVGDAVRDWTPGIRVAVQSNLFCGHCEFCQQGEESICLNSQLLGIQIDGGFAELVKVPARALVRLPDDVSYETSASLTLAGSTAMHMLTSRLQVLPGQWVLVIGGASGVGSAGIQIAKGLGGRVIATASSDSKRALAQALGADHVLDASQEHWPAEVRRITQKRGVDIVLEHVGGTVFEKAFHCLARGGTIVTCGATAGREVKIQLWPMFVKQQRVIGSYGRNRADIKATLDWAAAGKLRAVIDRVFSLEGTPAAFACLRNREVLGKLLISPHEVMEGCVFRKPQ